MNGNKKRILLVEDNDDNRQLLRIYLTREGYEVLEAADGVEALEIIRESPPDLVISDVQMPRMDGYTLCERLRQDAETEQLPIILITALYTSMEDILEGLHRGANDFLRSPFRQSELLARVQTQLRIKELQDRLVQAERAATVGQMTVTVAHEINNPLTGILGHVEILLREMEQGTFSLGHLRESLRSIRADALRIRDVLQLLRGASDREPYPYAPGLRGIPLDRPEGEPPAPPPVT